MISSTRLAEGYGQPASALRIVRICLGIVRGHYSAAELSRLLDAVNSVCVRGQGKPELVVLRRLRTSNIS